MPGNIVIKPIEANLTRNVSAVGKMNPYYVVSLGDSRQKGQVCKKGGKSPAWTDAVTVVKTADPFCVVEIKAKRALLPDKMIGTCKITVEELSEEKSARWYDLLHKDKVAGKILIEANLMAGEGELVTGHNVQPMATHSANVLDEKSKEPLVVEQNERNATSLHNLPPSNLDGGYEVKVIQPVEQNDMMQVPVMDSKGNVDALEEEKKAGFVGVGEDVKHVDSMKQVEEMKEEAFERRDSQFGDAGLEIPEERTAEEGLSGRTATDRVTRQRV